MGVAQPVLTGGYLHPVPTVGVPPSSPNGGYPHKVLIGGGGVFPSSSDGGYPHPVLTGGTLGYPPLASLPISRMGVAPPQSVLDGGTPPRCGQTDRHEWKHYLPHSFGMRVVIKPFKKWKTNLPSPDIGYLGGGVNSQICRCFKTVCCMLQMKTCV